MARKRFIDPAIFSDEKFVTLSSDSCRLFYIGVFSNCDDYGRILWQCRSLIGLVFPIDETKSESDIKAMMDELVKAQMIHAYTVNGMTFAHLPKWIKYQAPSHPSASKIPPPTCCQNDTRTNLKLALSDTQNTLEPFTKDSRNTHESIVKDSIRGWVGLGMGWGGEEIASLAPDVLTFVRLAAEENKTGRIAESRIKGIVSQLGGVLAECGELRAFRDGLRESIGKGKPNANYVRACVRSALQRSGNDSMPKRRAPRLRVVTQADIEAMA